MSTSASPSPAEGTYKFCPIFAGAAEFPADAIQELNQWREELVRRDWIGVYQQGEYKGFGYGNISCRSTDGFIITATATGGIPQLTANEYTEIIQFDLDANTVHYRAKTEKVRPSAECMTHGAFYRADPSIQAVVHIHHLGHWKKWLNHLPTTDPQAAYGTPEMGQEILRLYRESPLATVGVAVMGGHEEGIISLGTNLEQACSRLFAKTAE